MSKGSFKSAMSSNKRVFAIPCNFDTKSGKATHFRITDSVGRNIRMVKNGLSS